jgi:hypothetical protein
MKNYTAHMGGMLLGVLLLAAPLFAEEQTVLKSRSEKENYAIGVEFVRTLQQRAGAVNLDLVIQGMQDALTGEHLLMNEADIRTSLASAEDARKQMQKEASRSSGPMVQGTGAEPAPAVGKGGEPSRQVPGQDSQLAQTSTSGVMNSNAASGRKVHLGDSAVQPGLNGSILSYRNQAKLMIDQMKAEMRARETSGGASPGK